MEKTIKEQIEKLHESFTDCEVGNCVIIIGCKDGISFSAIAGRPIDIVLELSNAMCEENDFNKCVFLATAAYKNRSSNIGDF
ncbi:MAG: hypothetical protein RR513_09120 [Muribaculaceae bacterium]